MIVIFTTTQFIVIELRLLCILFPDENGLPLCGILYAGSLVGEQTVRPKNIQ